MRCYRTIADLPESPDPAVIMTPASTVPGLISELGKPGPYALRKSPGIQRWRVLKEPGSALTGEVPNVEMVREHAKLGGFPADSVQEIRAIIDPTTAEEEPAVR